MGVQFRRLLFDLDGFGHAFFSRLSDQIFVLLRDLVKLDNGQQLVFVIFENFRTKFVAVAVTHALLVDAHFHLSLLLAPAGRLVLKNNIELNTWLLGHFSIFSDDTQ